MEIEIISFGQIAEFLKLRKLELNDVRDTEGLKTFLEKEYPKLKGIKYKLALNKFVVHQNTELSDRCTIAIMPPFSGG
ncbi:MoaD/ThiS family protein [Pedobacter sp. JCM 36344]|uniref:MoaD/ThiS family protein n=1 Tax=Pedobacter sp. JCM 36344 TaxID=3374280 RepID=UPI00397804CF